MLDELLCFLSCPEFDILPIYLFFLESFFLAFFFVFRRNLPRKFLRNSREICSFLREFVSKNPAKFDFFSRQLSEALLKGYQRDDAIIKRKITIQILREDLLKRNVSLDYELF